jgi:hypothetical protein
VRDSSDSDVTTAWDTPVELSLAASDPDGRMLAYSVLTPPSHGELIGIAPNLTNTLDLSYNGADSFDFAVSGGMVDSDPATVSITVAPSGPPNQVQNGGFKTAPPFWEQEIWGTAAAALLREDPTVGEGSASARVEVTAPGTFMRHVRFQQTGLLVVEGGIYPPAFWAKAPIHLAAARVPDPCGRAGRRHNSRVQPGAVCVPSMAGWHRTIGD